MDEMKIKLSTRFMRGMVAKILSKVIYKKFGIKPDIQINMLETEMKDGKIRFRIDMDGSVSDNIFTKISKMVDEEEL